ncbi:MAG: SPOR domain-containing protein [Flammeovirgaceae bacterium]|nr:SPOR domain-containing protein [Flammeovirgaceae bacterium]MDW8286542.1 SPOR domain-containing protein [Flammeovirgaceae bacterium]
MYKVFYLTIYISLATLFGCSSTKPTAKTATPFEDDLAPYRPKIDFVEDTSTVLREQLVEKVSLQDDLAGKLQEKLQQSSQFYGQYDINGFRVLAYSGSNRERAYEAREKLTSLLEQLSLKEEISLVYEQPNYKLKVGTFISKFEANALCFKLRSEFPSAILIQEGFKHSQLRFMNE